MRGDKTLSCSRNSTLAGWGREGLHGAHDGEVKEADAFWED